MTHENNQKKFFYLRSDCSTDDDAFSGGEIFGRFAEAIQRDIYARKTQAATLLYVRLIALVDHSLTGAGQLGTGYHN